MDFDAFVATHWPAGPEGRDFLSRRYIELEALFRAKFGVPDGDVEVFDPDHPSWEVMEDVRKYYDLYGELLGAGTSFGDGTMGAPLLWMVFEEGLNGQGGKDAVLVVDASGGHMRETPAEARHGFIKIDARDMLVLAKALEAATKGVKTIDIPFSEEHQEQLTKAEPFAESTELFIAMPLVDPAKTGDVQGVLVERIRQEHYGNNDSHFHLQFFSFSYELEQSQWWGIDFQQRALIEFAVVLGLEPQNVEPDDAGSKPASSTATADGAAHDISIELAEEVAASDAGLLTFTRRVVEGWRR